MNTLSELHEPPIESLPPRPAPARRLPGLTAGRVASLLLASGVGGFVGAAIARSQDESKINNQSLERLVDNLAQSQGLKPATLLGKGLRDPSDLPSAGKPVSTEQKRKLAGSTVTVLTRKPNAKYAWNLHCNGTKTSISGHSYILTAQHCLNSKYDNSQLAPGTRAANVLPLDSETYAIGEATTDSKARNFTPLATVKAASIIVGGYYRPDMALLSVQPSAQEKRARAYEQIPSLSVSDYLSQPPQPGAAIAQYSVPSWVRKTAVSAIGTYLGRVKDPNQKAQLVDVIGLRVGSALRDPAGRGGSGSSAISSNGHLFPALSDRYPVAAEKDSSRFQPDDPASLTQVLRISEDLRLKADSFTVLATTVVAPRAAFSDLVRGLNRPIPN